MQEQFFYVVLDCVNMAYREENSFEKKYLTSYYMFIIYFYFYDLNSFNKIIQKYKQTEEWYFNPFL